ncbi:flagellar basal body rod C-terminal domain-containing protein [Undibacterium cyanobacteriorum]|uniref:Flagellar basal body rod C-terminal domain-containing protein n=1 Tax=Undibacterium cyanobacteriorum TaxID=3073561 RepID=A0ABY9RN83_9BURK|nr:flagellar basal body rod C-terminal domain-containing protein [Undibacterium sp. 20NA77.5]WMW82279.1 flagellar basal body rod C-terminal domain-containing protein [Undibacterium sp. 20NA77.5]
MAISAINTGLSAMRAYDTALSSSAHNIANANTNGFQPQSVQFQEAPNGGVTVNISQKSKSMAAQDPGNAIPSNTDLTTEITDSLQFKIGFQMAAKLVQTGDEMLDSLLKMR